MFYKLTVKQLIHFDYSIMLSDSMGFIKWSTTCSEIDLAETLEKVLRVTENLRKLP